MYTPGKSKEYIRQGVFEFFEGADHALTLPNLYFGLEERLLNNGTKVDCSEYRVNTFKGAFQIKPDGITLYNKNVKNLDLSIYDALFFDFYGSWNKSIEQILPSIKKDAKLVVTFLMARESRRVQEFIDIRNREDSYVKLFNIYGFKVHKYMNYCDTTPMCVFYCSKTL